MLKYRIPSSRPDLLEARMSKDLTVCLEVKLTAQGEHFDFKVNTGIEHKFVPEEYLQLVKAELAKFLQGLDSSALAAKGTV